MRRNLVKAEQFFWYKLLVLNLLIFPEVHVHCIIVCTDAHAVTRKLVEMSVMGLMVSANVLADPNFLPSTIHRYFLHDIVHKFILVIPSLSDDGQYLHEVDPHPGCIAPV